MKPTSKSNRKSSAKSHSAKPRPKAPAPLNPRAEKKAIDNLNKEWGAAATRADLETVLGLYASDGVLVWPDEPPHIGAAAIREAWSGMFKTMPGAGLEFIGQKLNLSAAGDLAIDFGAVKFSQTTDGKTTPMGVGKYLVVWKKTSGAWKVWYDSYSLNEPSAPPAAKESK